MKTETRNLTVTYTDDKGKEAQVVRQIPYTVPENAADVVTLMNADLDEVLASYKYGRSLREGATQKAIILKEVEGPGKSIDKQVKAFVDTMAAMGLKITEDAARAQVMTMIDAAKGANTAPQTA